MNKITKLLNIKYPILQGAMAHISTYSLVSAVSNAGGLGILASGGLTKEILKEQIKKTKELTDKPFAVNLMMLDKNVEECVEAVIEENVKIVTTGAGTPKNYMKLLKENNIIVIPVVPNVKTAIKMEQLGADAIVVEGTEAGGHIGEMTTFTLIQAVSSKVNIPIIAAGGIHNGKGLLASMVLGACAVQIGTRFIATHECSVSELYKESIINSDITVVTGRSTNTPVRSVKNEMTDLYLEMEKINDREQLEKLTLGSLRKAVNGNIKEGTVMAGAIVSEINDIKSVLSVIEDIISEYHSEVKNVNNYEI